MGVEPRLFDLNIEEVLDHWEVEHAIRELIANALDEQLLTGSPDIEIFEDERGVWHVRDFGRGLQIEHFTLNENKEKLASQLPVIGKFGVGLKDALATLHRRGIGVTITSPFGTFVLREAHKHNFDAITTLHVEQLPAVQMAGTDVALDGVSAADIAAARALFLRFSGDEKIEATQYGEILRRDEGPGRVYIAGVFASEEPNFLFSYNVTSLTPAMKKRLNRERLNVGRTTYADRVKAILRAADSEEVCQALADQVVARSRGDQRDEMQWVEIAHRALNLLHERAKVAFVTEQELIAVPDIIDHMRNDGHEVVVVDGTQKGRLDDQYRDGDTDLRTLEGFLVEYNESFAYEFVDVSALSASERALFDRTPEILALIGVGRGDSPEVRISETMRVGLDSTLGVWDLELRSIVIKRAQLCSLPQYAATLLHEAAHATTGTSDVTREFEAVLTGYLGRTADQALA